MQYLSGERAEQSQPSGMEGNIGSDDAQHIPTAQGAGGAPTKNSRPSLESGAQDFCSIK